VNFRDRTLGSSRNPAAAWFLSAQPKFELRPYYYYFVSLVFLAFLASLREIRKDAKDAIQIVFEQYFQSLQPLTISPRRHFFETALLCNRKQAGSLIGASSPSSPVEFSRLRRRPWLER
jgi:hypothetical protein